MSRNYSANSKRTGRRWNLNPNRPRTYWKTLYFSDLGDRSDGSVFQLPHGIYDIGTVVSIYGVIKDSNVDPEVFGTERSIPYINPKNLNDGLAFDVNEDVVGIVANADWTGFYGHVVIEYLREQDM